MDLSAIKAGKADTNGRTEQEITAEIEELDSILKEMTEDVQAEVLPVKWCWIECVW